MNLFKDNTVNVKWQSQPIKHCYQLIIFTTKKQLKYETYPITEITYLVIEMVTLSTSFI